MSVIIKHLYKHCLRYIAMMPMTNALTVVCDQSV